MAIIRPDSDILTTGWSSTGASFYTEIDETSASDSDYIESSTVGAKCQLGLQTAASLGTTPTLTYRAATPDSGNGLIARVIETGSFPFIIPQRKVWTRQPKYSARIDPSKNISHAWALNVRGARQLQDSAGNAHGVFGSGTGGTTGNYWVIGPDGWEILFDNSGTGTTSSTKLLVGNASGSAAPRSTRWTFEANVVVPTSSRDQPIIGGTSNSCIEIRVSTARTLQLLKQGAALIGSSSGTLTADVRYRIAVSYDGTNAAFYINGKASGTASSVQTFSAVQYSLGWGPGITEYLDNGGRIGRAVFTERVLSAAEIMDRYLHPWKIFKPLTPVLAGDPGYQVIAERTPTLTTSPANYTIELTADEKVLVVDPANLGLEFETT